MSAQSVRIFRTVLSLGCAGLLCTATTGCGSWGKKRNETKDILEESTEPLPKQAEVPVEQAVKTSTTGYAWDGQYSAFTVKAPFNKCLSQSLRVFKSLEFALDSKKSRRSTNGARLFAKNRGGLAVELYLKGEDSGSTLIRSRVGLLGDRSGSERVLDEMRKGLTGP